jgi:putative endopeptidase
MKTLWLSAAAAAALAVAAPALAQPAAAVATDAASTSLTQAPRMGTWGFDLSGRNPAVSP